MTDVSEEILLTGGRLLSARLSAGFRRTRTRRSLIDGLASRFVVAGGLLIIASILAILIVITAQVAPLFRPPTARPVAAVDLPLPSSPLAVGVDEHRQIVYLVVESAVRFASLADGRTVGEVRPDGLGDARIISVSTLGRGQFGLGLSDGRVIPVEVTFDVQFREGTRTVEPELSVQAALDVAEGEPVRHLAYTATSRGSLLAAVTGARDLTIVGIRETQALVGPSTRDIVRTRLSLPIPSEITQIVMDSRGDHAYVGWADGRVTSVDLGDPSTPKVEGSLAVTSRPEAGVSALSLLIGDRTLLVGDQEGGVTSWLILPGAPPAGLMKAHDFEGHRHRVAAVVPSRRDKGFLSLDAGGAVHVHYATTGRTLLMVSGRGDVARSISFAPKADGFVVTGPDGRLSHWALDNPHPQITLRSLFGRVLYEGYSEPTYVWQSTGATDDYEEKFSLVPLIYGTLKGTFYAMLIAVPLALMSALYTSQFMHPALKGIVKPVVEIMAALPSVILGFLAGLWLAPMIEKVVVGVFLIPLVVPLGVIPVLLLWQRLRGGGRTLRPGTEVAVLIPAVVVCVWAALRLGGAVEAGLLGGDFRTWLHQVFGVTYDQRNSLVVGIAMGFAIIPIIFTIAEDALSNVPPYLAAGSLALGATRWQTAARVVLPTASPGIFSAVMIGFGRAVGETMIVLMATGNTPVMDWSIFNGFRALSANIAVELPEAPQGGSLYRVLFLTALLLFILTFLINTAAETVRLRLRRRYQAMI